ncbi:MAG: FAD-dependent oxidoreductase [Synechococcaceae cyanobacterium SM2_3_1]|nr:FAD-dependent oxidoreductase [Synechococcaceae cyanobacterium SM2_3_1]
MIGCGVVGAAIAYELSRAGLQVVGVDAGDPGSAATGAALGVLMAVSSRQARGEVVDLRLQSLKRFDPLVENLEQDLGRSVPVNRAGLLQLVSSEALSEWQETIEARRVAGFDLQWLDLAEVMKRQPHLRPDLQGALFSPEDRQVEPRVLTWACIQAAQGRGAQFLFQQRVQDLKQVGQRIHAVYTPNHTISAGTVVITAGLGSSDLGERLGIRIPLQPVKGQALQVYSPHVQLRHVVTDDDLHLVPLVDGSLWIGATVEFAASMPQPTLQGMQILLQKALVLCPGLADAQLRSYWSGERPRPSGQRAPILGFSPAHENVILATGHYRNGVLLAPITAAIVQDLVTQGTTDLCHLPQFQLRMRS